MKLISIFIFLALAFGFSRVSLALDIYGIYTSGCQREIGTIVDVRDQNFDILTIDGAIKTLSRYQAIYMATYPIDILPIPQLSTNEGVEIYSIESLSRGEIKPLLKGWAINFNKQQVSFLTTDRDEVLVDKTDIWNIKKEKKSLKLKKLRRTLKNIYFQDPYPFSSCKRKLTKNIINPQKLYANATDVKKEFDRLQLGHQDLETFIRRKAFYPRPEVYTNKSVLGIWLMPSARYGASGSRSNSFSPFLTNELSFGAYSYQHLLTTGAGPILDGTHAETQMHFYYRMKAEYIHFAFMIDPNLFLVGRQYDWRREDMDDVDFRANETTFIEFGLDYGKFSFEYSPGIDITAAVKFGEQFGNMRFVNLQRFGLRYTGLDYIINFMMGANSSINEFNKSRLQIMRLNLQKKILSKDELTISIINKSVDGSLSQDSQHPTSVDGSLFQSSNPPTSVDGSLFQSSNPPTSVDGSLSQSSDKRPTYEFNSWSISGTYKYEYKRRFYFSALLGAEFFTMKANDITPTGNVTPYEVSPTNLIFGANAALKF